MDFLFCFVLFYLSGNCIPTEANSMDLHLSSKSQATKVPVSDMNVRGGTKKPRKHSLWKQGNANQSC